MEVEGQIRQLQQMLQQQKEAEEELVARIGKLQEEKRELQDRLASFQRGLSSAEQETKGAGTSACSVGEGQEGFKEHT